MISFDFENELYSKGSKYVCGVDEAGRGPLAGPVYAAAVILPRDLIIDGLNDSKKLSEKKRDIIFDVIIENALDYSIAYATHTEIDEINILNATFLAMQRAIDGLKIKPDHALIDGNRIPPSLKIDSTAIVKGDSLSYSIAAASILAKVSRDRVMAEYDKAYPEYKFHKHKGYPTEIHRNLVKQFGPCEIHRMSFLKKILSK